MLNLDKDLKEIELISKGLDLIGKLNDLSGTERIDEEKLRIIKRSVQIKIEQTDLALKMNLKGELELKEIIEKKSYHQEIKELFQ